MGEKHMEILAPAGDGDMLRAAVYSGADCVYLGVEGFNARRGAKNFGPDALQEAVAFCHARGCGVYAALNTLVQPGEEEALRKAVRGVADAGCDAIIVQDLATALAVQRAAPGVQLHGSTQMSVHSLAGVKKLAGLGFSRAILARELTEEEIASIAAQSPIELEVFVHGALCVCVSGQCTMSAFLGGRSANRGACAGPCRLPFRAQAPGQGNTAPAEGENHLSLKDLSILDALPRLQNMGIASAKIEGRLRGPEYVAVVVDAARKARAGQPYNKRLLADVFSRSGFTDGWFTGENGKAMFGTRTAADTAALKVAMPAARELYRREMPRVPVAMRLTLTAGGATLVVADADGHTVEAVGNTPLSKAQKDATEALEKALGKTGGTPFYVRGGGPVVEANGFFMPSGAANALRREALENLLAQREIAEQKTVRKTNPLVDMLTGDATPAGPCQPQQEQPQRHPLPASNAASRPTQKTTAGPALRARFESLQGMPANALDFCGELALPLEQWRDIPEAVRQKTWLWLPRILFPDAEEQAAAEVAAAAGAGFAGFEVNSLAHIELCKGQTMRGGFGLNITNADALRLYTQLGCTAATLSTELTLQAMASIARDVPEATTDMLAYGHLPLMVTRADPLANTGGLAHSAIPQNRPPLQSGALADRKGKCFAVQSHGAVREIYNPVPLWLADRLGELPTDSATLYFTGEDARQAAAILQAYQKGEAAKGEFTRGLYDKGTV